MVKLNMHSVIDAITNSSTETYSLISEGALVFVKDLIAKVLKDAGVDTPVDELYDITFEYAELEADRVYEDITCCWIEKEAFIDKYDELNEAIENIFKEYVEEFDLICERTGERPTSSWQMDDKYIPELLDRTMAMLGISKEEYTKQYMEDWERHHESAPIDRSIIITPKNKEAEKFEMNLNTVIETGIYCC